MNERRKPEQIGGQADGRVVVYHPLYAAIGHPDRKFRPRPVASIKAREILQSEGWSQRPQKYDPDWTPAADKAENAKALAADPDGIDLATISIGELRDLYAARLEDFEGPELNEAWTADELRWELREMYDGNAGNPRPEPEPPASDDDEADDSEDETEPEPPVDPPDPEPTVAPAGRRPAKKKATKKKAAKKKATTKPN